MAKNLNEILSESVGLSEDTKTQIVELWQTKVTEAREEVSANLREEFARKFEHDKSVLVESIDRFLTDKVRAELEEFAVDKQQLVAERVNYRAKISEHAKMLDKFITQAMVKEVKELHTDKKVMKENFRKLENFLMKQLAEEIQDFRSDKKSLVEQKVRMVTEGKQKLQETKLKFIKRAASLIESTIDKTLRSEISQFKDDIRVAKENEFGRKMFESFAAEFMTSHLNEGTELKKLQRVLESKDAEVKALKESVNKNKNLIESLDVKLKSTQDLVERQKVMNELLAPLSKDKKVVMKELLETVQTAKLQGAYNKYLPSVLNETAVAKLLSVSSQKTQLNESGTVRSEYTGNKERGAFGSRNLAESKVSSANLGAEETVELKQILSLAGIAN